MMIELIYKKVILRNKIHEGGNIMYKKVRHMLGNYKRLMIKKAATLPIIPKRYYCSACGKKSAYFLNWGMKSDAFERMHIIGGGVRKNVLCTQCYANDRMRWIDYVITNMTNLYTEHNTVLHIAPEYCIEAKMKKNTKTDYITGDICEGVGDLVVDVTDMQFADMKFDYIILNHVLEHVKDEKKALLEINRCLKKNGKVLFSMPLCLDRDTYELDRDLTPEERLNEYGQEDHYRLYGKNVIEHIEKFGFKVNEYRSDVYLTDEQIKKMHILKEDRVFIGEKL